MPRFLLAYKAPKKKEFLATIVTMIVSGVLQVDKQTRKALRSISQDELAKMSGVASRSTFTRRLGMFRPADPVDADHAHELARNKKPKCSDPDSKCPCRGAGHSRKHDRRPHAQIVHRKRRIAKPNIYALRLPEGAPDEKTQQQDPKRQLYIQPSLADLLEHPEFSDLFADADNVGGNKDIPVWLFDKALPITDTARLVMLYYFLCGLGSRHRDGHMIGEIHPKQETVAAALGISVKSVYNANQELEGLQGVIRVVQDDLRVDGPRKMRGPAKILYLPLRTMTHDDCVAEADRLLKAKDRLQDPSWWDRAAGIHTALLRAWEGKEHLPGSFNKEFRRQLREAGAPRFVRDDLAPRSD